MEKENFVIYALIDNFDRIVYVGLFQTPVSFFGDDGIHKIKNTRMEYLEKCSKEKIVERLSIWNLIINGKEEKFRRLREIQKVYWKKNYEEIRKKAKEKVVCECGHITSRQVISIHKRSQKHKDALLNGMKKIDRVSCQCGCKITKPHLARHRKTMKHAFRKSLQKEGQALINSENNSK